VIVREESAGVLYVLRPVDRRKSSTGVRQRGFGWCMGSERRVFRVNGSEGLLEYHCDLTTFFDLLEFVWRVYVIEKIWVWDAVWSPSLLLCVIVVLSSVQVKSSIKIYSALIVVASKLQVCFLHISNSCSN